MEFVGGELGRPGRRGVNTTFTVARLSSLSLSLTLSFSSLTPTSVIAEQKGYSEYHLLQARPVQKAGGDWPGEGAKPWPGQGSLVNSEGEIH